MSTAPRAVARAVAVFTTLLATAPAPAHETWAWPTPGKGAPPVPVRIVLETSSRFPSGDVATPADRLDTNLLVGASDLMELKSWKKEGAALAARTGALATGHYLFQFALKPKRVQIAPAAFEAYLREEGLDAAARERRRRKETGKPGRERFVKLGKALIRVGEPATEPSLAGAGLLLDLVPSGDPTRWQTGDTVEVVALYQGKPALAKPVTLHCSSGGKATKVTALTDAAGVAKLAVPAGDRCMLSVVDMRRIEDGADVDWESVWHTFTFLRRP